VLFYGYLCETATAPSIAYFSDYLYAVSLGWAISDHMRTLLCVDALQVAFWRRKPKPGLLHHSDRGS